MQLNKETHKPMTTGNDKGEVGNHPSPTCCHGWLALETFPRRLCGEGLGVRHQTGKAGERGFPEQGGHVCKISKVRKTVSGERKCSAGVNCGLCWVEEEARRAVRLAR